MLKTNTKPKWLFLSPDELELFIKKTKFFLVALLCVAFGVEVVSGQTLKNLSKIRHKSKPSKKWLILFAAGTKSLERVWGWKTRTYDVPLWSIANQSNHHSFFTTRDVRQRECYFTHAVCFDPQSKVFFLRNSSKLVTQAWFQAEEDEENCFRVWTLQNFTTS